jgi:hypothetical protein
MNSKDSYYFPHDYNARNDNKIISVRMKYGAAGYGVYFMLIEKLRESADYKCVKDYNTIAFDLRVDASIVKSIVEDFGLFAFTESGECFYSESLLQRMIPLDNLRKKRSKAGKAGMKNRWESEQLKQTDNNVITQLPKSDNNKSKVNKSNKKEIPSNEGTKKESRDSSCPPEIKESFDKFNKWMNNNALFCSNPKNFTHQISLEEFRKLKEKYTSEQIANVILQIENRKDLRKRYSNLYRTVLNWAKKEYGE